MATRKRLSALFAAGLIVSLLLGSGCGILNPEFVNQQGGNPIPGSTNISGYVLIVLNNLTAGAASLTYEFDLRKPGTSTLITDGSTMTNGIPGFFAMSIPCGVTEVRLVSARAFGGGFVPDPDAEDDPTLVELPTTMFKTPVLQCGSVIFVTITGSAGSAVADVQIIN
jgi:hypothetical protein